MSRLALLICALFATATLPGCSSSGTASKSGTGPAAGSVLVQNSLPPPASIANDVGLRRNVAITGCKRIDGGWRATGTAANASAKDVTYTVTIFFTTKQATVLDFATTTVSVAAGGTATWTASKKFSAPDGTLCVLRGVG